MQILPFSLWAWCRRANIDAFPLGMPFPCAGAVHIIELGAGRPCYAKTTYGANDNSM